MIEVNLNSLPFDNPIVPNPKIEYAALYGPCSAQLQTFGYNLGVTLKKNRCQLKADSLLKKSICQTPFKKCISKVSENVFKNEQNIFLVNGPDSSCLCFTELRYSSLQLSS